MFAPACRKHIKFNHTVLIVNGIEMPLRDTPGESVVVVVDEDIKLPPRTAVRCRLMIKEKFKEGVFQLTLADKYGSRKDKVPLCETIVEVAELVIMLANQANKTEGRRGKNGLLTKIHKTGKI